MNHCPNCQYENLPTSTFCGHCGASLTHSSSPLEPTYRASDQTPVPIPPPPPGYVQSSPLAAPRRRQYKRTVGGMILSLLFYIWGAFWFSFALGGGILYDPTNPAVSGLIVIGCCIAGLIVLIPLLLYRTHFRLLWWVRLLLEIGLMVIGFPLVFVVVREHFASHSSTMAYDQNLGIAFVLYGLAAAFIAFW